MVSIGVSWFVFWGFFLVEPLVAGEDTDGVTGGVSGEVANAGGVAEGAVVVIGVGSVVETAFGPKSLTGEADTGFFSPLFGDFLFFPDTSSVLG